MVNTINLDLQLLKKAAREKNSREYSESELRRLATLLDLERLFENFSEKELRVYKDEYSGQSLYGRKSIKNGDGEMMYVSFIPNEEATRSQLFDSLIFSYINPAVINLGRLLFSLQPSDYASMHYTSAIAWARLSDVLTEVKAWSDYIDTVVSPGAMISPMMGYHDASNLLMDSRSEDIYLQMSRLCGEFEFV